MYRRTRGGNRGASPGKVLQSHHTEDSCRTPHHALLLADVVCEGFEQGSILAHRDTPHTESDETDNEDRARHEVESAAGVAVRGSSRCVV